MLKLITKHINSSHHINILLMITILVLNSTLPVHAHPKKSQRLRGNVKGKIVDETTQNALPAVNVMIEGTQMGTAADFERYYSNHGQLVSGF